MFWYYHDYICCVRPLLLMVKPFQYAPMNLPHLGKRKANFLEAQNKHIKDAIRNLLYNLLCYKELHEHFSECVLGLMKFERQDCKNREFQVQKFNKNYYRSFRCLK